MCVVTGPVSVPPGSSPVVGSVDLDVIEARADAATPGPWFFAYSSIQSGPKIRAYDDYWTDERGNDGHTYEHHVGRTCPACGPRFVEGREDDPRMQIWDCALASEALDHEPTVAAVAASYGDTATGQRVADAEFIAHARSDVPALLAEVRRLASELAGVRVELERTEGDWAVAIREASRARAALARVEAIHVLVQCPTSEHFYCRSGECDRAGEGELRDLCDLCDRWWPCPTIAALSVAATDTEETTDV